MVPQASRQVEAADERWFRDRLPAWGADGKPHASDEEKRLASLVKSLEERNAVLAAEVMRLREALEDLDRPATE